MKPVAVKTVSSPTVKILVSCLLILGAILSSLTVNAFTQTQMASVTETVLSTTVTIRATCHWIWWDLIIAPGTFEIVGTIGPASSSINFYIMNQQQYSGFEAGGASYCGRGPYPALVASELNSTSAYALQWKNPPPGNYILIFYSAASSLSIIPFTLRAIFNLEQSTATTTISTTVIMTTYQSTTTVTIYTSTTTTT